MTSIAASVALLLLSHAYGAAGVVKQRGIEIVIGKLVTDDELRQQFVSDPRKTLLDLLERGTPLTRSEMIALMAIDRALWESVAEQIDPLLQKATSTDE